MIRLLVWFVLLLTSHPIQAADADFVPVSGKFPPVGVGVYLAGELVSVDHVNRRGAIRLVGDNSDDRYHWAPSHQFALLPYGMVRYHGAPAELRDVPIGTVLHGYFVLPPAGDTTIPPPPKNAEKYVPKQNHALTLEDDFSFYQRQGQSWKIVAVDVEMGSSRSRLRANPPPMDFAATRRLSSTPARESGKGNRLRTGKTWLWIKSYN